MTGRPNRQPLQALRALSAFRNAPPQTQLKILGAGPILDRHQQSISHASVAISGRTYELPNRLSGSEGYPGYAVYG